MVGQPVIPKRRSTAHVETVHGELCIYEWTTKTVHALNPAAARVWELCDGSTTVEGMTAAVQRDLNAPGAASIVEHALAQFDRAGLLEPGTLAGAGPLVSRRALLRTIGVAAAIPVVTSIVAPTPLAAQSGHSVQFNVTGAPQSFIVPAGITSLQVDVVGASGGGITGLPGEIGGPGGRVEATLPVTPGETLTIMVGSDGLNGGPAGFNGGGQGSSGAFGGGGASDIRRGATKLIIAGGGGGGAAFTGGNGGAGGGLVAASGIGGCGGGGGGTQSAGGAGGTGGSGGTAGSPGTSGTGGAGAPGVSPSTIGGSGGGGGYFGGGGGGSCGLNGSAPGGGGSSVTDPSATGVVHTQGFGGSPRITVSW